MKFIFKDSKSDDELTLPVTPKGFEASHGKRVEMVNIHAVGDVAIGGYASLASIKVSCMFPAREYAFSQSMGMGPYDYVKQFELWALDPSAIVRFIVTETPVNIPVLVESIDYGERDGTGDVYATISLREYRELAVVQTQKAEKTENLSRPDPEPPVTSQTHIVVSGDTLWAIARKYYGDGLLAYHLATYNGIKNANLIYPGQAVNLPDKSLLGAA